MKLEIPVSYQGGKQRLAPKIIDIIMEETNIRNMSALYDMCCGTGAVSLEFLSRQRTLPVRMVDSSVWGYFWEAISNGWFSLDEFSKIADRIPPKGLIKNYLETLSKKDVDLDYLYNYLLLQAGSFGGKAIWIEGNEWKNASFRNYWKPTSTSKRRSPVNPMMPMPKTIAERLVEIVKLQGIIVGGTEDVSDFISFLPNSIIYIDPPYKNSTGYGSELDIDSWLKRVKDENIGSGSLLFVSEGYEFKNADKTFLLSEKRKKGNISGYGMGGVQEWLSVFKF